MWRSLWHHFLCYSSTLESPMNLKDAFSLFKYIITFPCYCNACVIIYIQVVGFVYESSDGINWVSSYT